MRSALWCALLFGIAVDAAAQERAITFEEPQPVTVSGFAVGRADYDRVTTSNTFTAGKIGLSLFKPVGDAYLFAQLTTALVGAESSTEIDNLLVSWTPHTANQWSLGFGRFDAPIGFERDDEPLNLIPTSSFNFTYARPAKLTGVQVHYTASPRVDVWAVAANGWDVTVDNNRGKTALARVQWIPIPWVTLGVTGVYGPERDSSEAHQRSLLSGDLTIDRGGGRYIVGVEANLGREQQGGGGPTWRGAAVTGFVRVARHVGLTARYDQMEDPDGLLTGTPQILRSVTAGPIWFFSSAREGIFSNIEHTRFHLPQIALRAALRADWSSAGFFPDAGGALQRSNTKGVVELVYVF
jgi:putative OmpL-like beta-barrel porin-2